jgi:MscS family membrane protein
VGRDNFRVRFVGIGESSFDLEIFCYILTSDLGQFFAIREDLLLNILDLMAAKGIGLAVPARALHLTQDQSLHDQILDQQSPQQRRRAA